MTQHTPGPWFRDIAHIGKSTFEGKLCEAVFKDEIDGERTLIALVVDSVNPDLIAAAPELLNALENLVIAIGMGWDLDGVIAVSEAAITKARGQS